RLSGLEGKAKKIAKKLDAIFEGIVKQHETRSNEKTQREQARAGTPFHRDTVKALTQEMFVGGTDTTTTAMEWAISEVIKHPRVTKKLQQELDEIAQGRQRITEEDL
nr:cytochrome P450 71A4-like [Tanacetum cinerariifolium]